MLAEEAKQRQASAGKEFGRGRHAASQVPELVPEPIENTTINEPAMALVVTTVQTAFLASVAIH